MCSRSCCPNSALGGLVRGPSHGSKCTLSLMESACGCSRCMVLGRRRCRWLVSWRRDFIVSSRVWISRKNSWKRPFVPSKWWQSKKCCWCGSKWNPVALLSTWFCDNSPTGWVWWAHQARVSVLFSAVLR